MLYNIGAVLDFDLQNQLLKAVFVDGMLDFAECYITIAVFCVMLYCFFTIKV